jgi:hypothetical protein
MSPNHVLSLTSLAAKSAAFGWRKCFLLKGLRQWQEEELAQVSPFVHVSS